MSKQIEAETVGAVRVIRLARPDAMNALSQEMFETLRAEFAGVASDDAIRAILLTASGRAFSVGADLKDPMMGFELPMEERAEKCRETLGGLMNGLIRDISTCAVPVVTAVNGVCAGGGVGLALASDLVVAGTSARFLLGFVPVLALTPDLGATWQLLRKLGRSRAMGLALTGREITADEALDWGLIWQTADDARLGEVALALATSIAKGPTGAQIALRGLLQSAGENDLDTQLAAECEAQLLRNASPEVAEAMQAFIAKRPADFSKLPRGT